MSVTLAELKERARNRADMTNSNFISDEELVYYINSSIAELHDILIQAYGNDYYIETSEFTTVANQDDYDLPADFYKMRGVDAQINGDNFSTLRQFNFNERNRYDAFGVWDINGIPAIRYRLIGDKIRFTPQPDKTVNVKLWYIPVATKLVNDTDTLNDINQFAEYVVVDAAIKMMAKEESDVSVLAAQKAGLIKRITEAAENRDAGDSQSVRDIHAENDDYPFHRG